MLILRKIQNGHSSAKCTYDPSLHDSCKFIVDLDMWYFASHATKHITSQHSFSISLDSTLVEVKELDRLFLLLQMVAPSLFMMLCMCQGSKKNLLSSFAFTKIGLIVKFVDDRCTVHDLSLAILLLHLVCFVEGYIS